MIKALHLSNLISKIKYLGCLLILFCGMNTGFSQTCTYTVELFDSFGDGWNGATLTVLTDGVSTDFTINDGGEATFTFDAMSNEQVTLTYSSGTFENEVTYNIIDPSGNVIFSDGPFPTTGEVFIFFACPTCPAPAAVFIDEIGGVDAEISWSPTDSSGVYTVEYDTLGFTPGTGLSLMTTDTSAILTGLLEDTEYEFYISIACDNGDTSATVGPFPFQTIWLIDVGAIDILTPLSQCGLGDEMVQVILQNFGADPQSLIPFNYSVNGVNAGVSQPIDGFFTGVLSNDSIVTLDFETTFDFSMAGEYEIVVWTSLEGDSNSSNDTISYTVTNIPIVSELPYFIDFEEWDGGWKIDVDESQNSTWAFGEPVGGVISNAASGINAFVTNLEGNYNNSELSYIVSPCFDFSGFADDPVINFSLNYNTETNWDGAWLEASTDSGMTWSKVGDIGTGVNWYTVNNTTQNLGPVWGGSTGGWINAEHPLDGLAGEPTVRFRFAFDSDGSVNGFDGVGIDDILITPVFADDLSTINVSNSSASDCGDEMDQVTIEIRNAGTNPQGGFDVSYQVDGGTVVTENVGALILPPGAIEMFTFTTPFNSQSFATDFEIQAWTNLDDELNVINDSSATIYSTVGFDALPLVADFEDAALPDGWVASDFGIGNVHNNVSVVVFDNLFGGDQNYELTTSNIGPINPGDSLTYDYRYTDWSAGTVATTLTAGDSLEVQISTDCGDSFTTIDVVNANNHTPSNVMTNRLVDLDAYAGEVIKIRFVATWGGGDYWIDLDNINIIGCPQDFGLDIAANYESADGAGDGSIEVNPTEGTAPFNIVWDDPNAPNDIGPGTYTATVTDALGCEQTVDVDLGTCPPNLDLAADITMVSAEGLNDGDGTINTGAGEGPYTFEWSNGDSTATASNLPVGEYTVTVTDVYGCSDAITFMVDVISSISDLENFANVSLAPNPTSGYTELSVELNESAEVKVQVLNLVGQVVFEAPKEQLVNKVFELNLSQNPGGMYFVRISAGDQLHTIKLIKAE